MSSIFHTLTLPDEVQALDDAVLRIRPQEVQAIRHWKSIGGHYITLTFKQGATVDVFLKGCLSSTLAQATAISFEKQISQHIEKEE